jgi:AraC family transcriptional regulator
MFPKLPSGTHHGAARPAGIFGNVTLVETYYLPNSKTKKHTHERSCYAILINGGYQENVNNGSLNCAAGDVVFMPSEAIHCEEISPQGARSLIVEVSDAFISKMSSVGNKGSVLNKGKHGEIGALARRIYQEWQRPDELSPISLEALAIELWCWFSRLPCDPKKPDWLRRVQERLQSDFKEKLTLARLAQEAGVHPAHLARSFRYHFRCTIGDFIRNARVQYAALQMQSTNEPLSSIALSAGFSHQAHFSRVFREIFGTTPGNYRATFRNCKKQ